MPVIVQDSLFDILPASTYNIKIKRSAPKVTFQSANGYKHQREKYSHARRIYDVEFIVNQTQLNTLDNWLDENGSNTFWWLPNEALWKDSASPTIRLVRISTEEISYNTILSGSAAGGPLYSVQFTMEEV